MIIIPFVGLYGIGKTSLIFKNTDNLLTKLSARGYDVKGYSLDNFSVYDNLTVFHAQIERIHYGSRKLAEAAGDHAHIALFDRSLFCNLLFSKCYYEFKQMTEREFLTIRKIFQSVQYRDLCFQGRTFYLCPPLSQVWTQICDRNNLKSDGSLRDGEKTRDGSVNSLLLQKEFVTRLQEIYDAFYEQFELTSPVYKLTHYTADTIIAEMERHDIIQKITE